MKQSELYPAELWRPSTSQGLLAFTFFCAHNAGKCTFRCILNALCALVIKCNVPHGEGRPVFESFACLPQCFWHGTAVAILKVSPHSLLPILPYFFTLLNFRHHPEAFACSLHAHCSKAVSRAHRSTAVYCPHQHEQELALVESLGALLT
jgi:hypothetical protein